MSNRKKTTTRGRPSKFPPEFRRDAVRMVIDEDRPIAEVGRAIGANPGTLLATTPGARRSGTGTALLRW